MTTNLTFAATWTNSGAPATGLTLTDIDLYLYSINKQTGVETAIWNSQNPTVEYTGMGTYGKPYTSLDTRANLYVFRGHYTGAGSVDIVYTEPVVIGYVPEAQHTLTSTTETQIDDIETDTNSLNDTKVPGTFAFTGTDVHATLDSEVVNLADDAITSAKFDESTAYPVKSADTGATQVARVGADSDTLETLSDQLDAVTTDTNELQTDWTNDGRLDVILDAILADTGTDGVVIATATAQAIADEILIRGVSNVEDSADAASLAAMILAAFESVISEAGTWTIYKTDHSTTFTTRTVTRDASTNPIVEVT